MKLRSRRRGGRRDPVQRAKDVLKQNKKSMKAKKKSNQVREVVTRRRMKDRAAKSKARAGKTGQLKLTARKPEALKKKLSNSGVLTADDYPAECDICGRTGELILCEGCPKSFRLGCVKLSAPPKGDWFCDACEEERAAKRKAKGKDIDVKSLSAREQRRIKREADQAEREKLQQQQEEEQALEKKEKPSEEEKKKKKAPLNAGKKRKAAQGPKNYNDDGSLPLADSGHRDYSGCLFKFRTSSGIVVDGIVVEMNEFREYVCQVIVVPMRTSDDRILSREERYETQEMRPSELAECVVPFDKVEGRWVHRILSSGKKKMGRVKKYLGPRTGPKTRTDPYTKKKVTEDVTEHMYRVVYPRYEYEDPETGEMREEQQTEEHLNSFQVAEWLEEEKGKASYPFKEGDDIPRGRGVDRMLITINQNDQGTMVPFGLTVPADCSVAQLMQIIWKESEWQDHYHPKWQKLEYSDDKEGVSHWISQPGKDFSKPLKKWGITHASNVQLSFRHEPMKMMDKEEKRRVIEEAMSNHQLALREMKDAANLTSSSKKKEKPKKKPGPSPEKREQGYEHWTVQEVTKLVDIVGDAFSRKWHLENYFWDRVAAAMGSNLWKNQDVRTKWRGTRHQSLKRPEDRTLRGISKDIPEEVFVKARMIAETLEGKAIRGIKRRENHEE